MRKVSSISGYVVIFITHYDSYEVSVYVSSTPRTTTLSGHCVSLTPEIVYQASGRTMTDHTHEVRIS